MSTHREHRLLVSPTSDGRLVVLGDGLVGDEVLEHGLADLASLEDGLDGNGTFGGKG